VRIGPLQHNADQLIIVDELGAGSLKRFAKRRQRLAADPTPQFESRDRAARYAGLQREFVE
jgi:hypothetical protein